MDTINSRVNFQNIISYKRFKTKSYKNLILISKTRRFQVVHMYQYRIISPKQYHFTKNQIKLILIKWDQVLKLNLCQGLIIILI